MTRLRSLLSIDQQKVLRAIRSLQQTAAAAAVAAAVAV